MSTLIPPPPPTVPLGRVIGTNVYIDPAWALYLTKGLFERVGGYNAPTFTEIIRATAPTMIFGDEGGDELVFVPGPQGPPGQASVQMVLLYEETQIDDIVFIPR